MRTSNQFYLCFISPLCFLCLRLAGQFRSAEVWLVGPAPDSPEADHQARSGSAHWISRVLFKIGGLHVHYHDLTSSVMDLPHAIWDPK